MLLPSLLEIPHANALRMIEVDPSRDPRFNLIHIDKDWFSNHLREWQHKTEYAQKFQFNDRIFFQFHANTIKGSTLELFDSLGRVRHTWNQSSYYTMSGLTIPYSDTVSLQGYTYTYYISFSQVSGLTEGIYYLQLSVDYDRDGDTSVDTTKYAISEPISIATTHHNTALIQYWHTTNKHDILYASTNVKFSLRVECDVQDLDPASNDIQYEDQDYDVQLLDAVAYEKYKFVTTKRVPDWMVRTLNKVWAHNKVKIDGEYFTKDMGAQWEVNRVPRVATRALSIPIRPADHRQGSIHVLPPSAELYTIPSFPYAIHQLQLDNGPDTIDIVSMSGGLGTGRVINDTTEQTALISYLNSAFAIDNNLTGIFEIRNGSLVYTNGEGEEWEAGTVSVYNSHVDFTGLTLVTSNSVTIEADLTGFLPGAVIDWGNGVIESNGSNATYIFAHNYGAFSGIPFTIRIFHDDSISVIDTSYKGITGMTGTFPASLTGLYLHGSLTTFNGSFLTPCLASLQYLDLSDNDLTTVVNFGRPYDVLTYIAFSDNNLSSVSVDALFNDYVANAGGLGGPPPNGTFLTDSQTPAAPPTGASLTARNALLADGWSITTD